jgi:class 3 adenylate cyclase/pimeloyl-ACP methyl ester carboxylesterase
MEPRIQYTTASDGVRIAYYTVGAGEAVVYLPIPPFSNIRMDEAIGELDRARGRYGGGRMFIRYDCRGNGMSDRSPADIAAGAYARDLEAVINAAGAERAALVALASSGPIAIEFAARHPERVSKLLLIGAWARHGYIPQIEALYPLIDVSWESFTETVSHMIFGWGAGEDARGYAAMIRDAVSAEGARRAFAASLQADVREFLPQVRCPVLVIHLAGSFVDPAAARELAAGIPGARLVVVDSSYAVDHTPGQSSTFQDAVDEFLGFDRPTGGEHTHDGADAPGHDHETGFRTILFTDIVGSTPLTQRLGDAGAREIIRGHERITRELFRAHGGAEIKQTGDGFMATFGSVTRALDCAIALQRRCEQRNDGADVALDVRIGINAGEPIAEGGDFFGTPVIIASRIAAQAGAREILVSNVVREIAAGKGFLFADRGETVLRGLEDPVRLYELRWRPD